MSLPQQTRVYPGRRLDPYAPDITLTVTDHQQAARTRTDFLDRCAAEARAAGWFDGIGRPRSTLCERVFAALAAQPHGATAGELAAIVGHERSATEKALRVLLDDGRARIATKRKWARVYEVVRCALTS